MSALPILDAAASSETSAANQRAVLQSMMVASRLAGLKIRRAFSHSTTMSFVTKSNSADLVTETDVQCQEVITRALLKDFPNHCIVGEESSEGSAFSFTERPTFIIDPIDGTSNFAKMIPHCAVLIARAVNRVVDCAVVLDPFRGELFYAVRGQGAFMDRLDLTTLAPLVLPSQEAASVTTRLQANTHVKTLREATVLTDLGYIRDDHGVALFLELQRAMLTDKVNPVRALRVLGSCGLGLAWVACGRADAYMERNGPLIWDFSGGSLLVTEAGGLALDPSGDELDLSKRSILVASSRELVQALVLCVKSSEANVK